jgi:excisionase family DNA binding protein
VTELAELLQVSPATLYGHAKQGRIPSFKVGFYVRFDPKSVAAWLRRQ